MTLTRRARYYHNFQKHELRGFIMQRLNLAGNEYKKASKKELVQRLLQLDRKATFRLFDLPPELREKCFENAVACASDFRRLLLVSKQVHAEVRVLFWEGASFDLSMSATSWWISGDPVCALTTRYRNIVNVHENPSGTTFAETLHLRHQMFRNIRHLSLKASGMVRSIMESGVILPQFEVGGSRVLFMISTFYAFADLPVHLKTFRYDAEDCEEPKNVTDIYRLFLTLWPLKLLAGRGVQIEIASLPKDWVEGLTLNVNDIDPKAIHACRRFAELYFSHQEPPTGTPASPETIKTFKKKMWDLGKSSDLITQDNVQTFVHDLEIMAQSHHQTDTSRIPVDDHGNPDYYGHYVQDQLTHWLNYNAR